MLIYSMILVACTLISSAVPSSAESMPIGSTNIHSWSPNYQNYSYNNSSIRFEDKKRISQAPTIISIGKGYYSSNPIMYGADIGSKTSIMNERLATFMHHDIDYAHGINGEMQVTATDSSYIFGGSELSNSAATHMKIDENVTNGKIHIEVLQGSDDLGKKMTKDGADTMIEALKEPAIQIDEDYFGTYHIYKNMTINIPIDQQKINDSWLNCCQGYYLNTDLQNSRFRFADEIFNSYHLN